MIKRNFTLISGSTVLASMLLTGCGSEVVREHNGFDKSPTNTIKNHRGTGSTGSTGVQSEKDWTWFVDTKAAFTDVDRDANIFNFSIESKFESGIPTDVKHLQFFVDIDNNAATGFSYGQDSWEISGADYLIEDGDLYKSTSNTAWEWTYVGSFDNYAKINTTGNTAKVSMSSSEQLITSIVDENNINKINVSIEPFDVNWNGSYSTISTQAVSVSHADAPAVQPPVVQPPVVQPPVVQPPVEDSTVYDDAENGISQDWTTVKGNQHAKQQVKGYKNQSDFHINLFHKWQKDAQGKWFNDAEYHLSVHDTTHKKLSIDIVGNGSQQEHYSLGVRVLTSSGTRYILWDSFYNHENLSAKRTAYDNGNIYMIFPSPVELVRGYGFSSPDLEENFTVDLEAALKHFEPDNEILTVERIIATGGNLDNITLKN